MYYRRDNVRYKIEGLRSTGRGAYTCPILRINEDAETNSHVRVSTYQVESHETGGVIESRVYEKVFGANLFSDAPTLRLKVPYSFTNRKLLRIQH